jgi:hypothetical protein
LKNLSSISGLPHIIKTTCFYAFIALPLILSRCANPVSPTGGPKDTTPPEIVRYDPPNYSINFVADKIEIAFNEFIVIKDANNQVVISPPFLPNTDYKLKGKSLIVQFDDPLKPNTTYSINFGEAIADNTEGNLLKDFNYVFSTGTYIDSLTIKGTIVDAFNLSPQKGILVMLYIDNNDTIPFDSLPSKVKPYYLTRSGENGDFLLKNLSSNEFKFFALKDLDGDYRYNLPEEKIGFIDSLLKASYIAPIVADTNVMDSIQKTDTLVPPVEKGTMLKVSLFQHYDSIQRLLKSTLVKEGEIGLYFRYPLKKPLFIPLNIAISQDWKTEEFTRKKDTVFLWLKNVIADSLFLEVSDNNKVLDTVRLSLKEKSDGKKNDKKIDEKSKKLIISSNIRGGSLKQFKSEPVLTFAYPLSEYNFKKVILIDGKDTIHPKMALLDSIKRSVKISYKWKEDKKYMVIIPDSCFFSIDSLTNDSLVITFKTNAEKDYGSLQLSVNLESRPGSYLIQLLDEKEILVEEKQISASGKVRFSYLIPKIYKIKAILDKNKNGRWDTGDYYKKIEPEEVFYFPKTVELRANWEVEENWDL